MKTCNNCGCITRQIQEINLKFSYGSFDNQTWNFNLCDNCIGDMVEGFERPPEGFISNASISKALVNAYRGNSVTEVLYDDYEAYVCYPSTEANKLKYNANGAIGECI